MLSCFLKLSYIVKRNWSQTLSLSGVLSVKNTDGKGLLKELKAEGVFFILFYVCIV